MTPNHRERSWTLAAVLGMLLLVAGFAVLFGAAGALLSAGTLLILATIDARTGHDGSQ